MTRFAGLLRAVNVGGRQVRMADLKRIAEDCGLKAPATLLASGNLFFDTDLRPAEAAAALETAIQSQLGMTTDVLVRDRADLEAVLAGNPFEREALEEPSRLLVMFLSGTPEQNLEGLSPLCRLGERVMNGPGCLYLFYPAGVGASKLTNAAIERRLKMRGTARNWNTVGKLAAGISA